MNDYQQQAARMLISGPGFELTDQEWMTVWCALGLAGEAGEVVDHIKKGVFHRHGIDTKKIEEELGDALWYCASLCTVLELDLSKIMQQNIDKLLIRYPSGYSSEDSINRKDKERK